jgi:hypothetical protein
MVLTGVNCSGAVRSEVLPLPNNVGALHVRVSEIECPRCPERLRAQSLPSPGVCETRVETASRSAVMAPPPQRAELTPIRLRPALRPLLRVAYRVRWASRAKTSLEPSVGSG